MSGYHRPQHNMINHLWKEVTARALHPLPRAQARPALLKHHQNSFKPWIAPQRSAKAPRQHLAQPELRNKQPPDHRVARDIQTNKEQK